MRDKGINDVYIKPRTPRLNGEVERSRRIDAGGFYRLLDGHICQPSPHSLRLERIETIRRFLAGMDAEAPPAAFWTANSCQVNHGVCSMSAHNRARDTYRGAEHFQRCPVRGSRAAAQSTGVGIVQAWTPHAGGLGGPTPPGDLTLRDGDLGGFGVLVRGVGKIQVMLSGGSVILVFVP